MRDELEKSRWYRNKAEELRVEAENATSATTRDSLLKLAGHYDALAGFYERSAVREEKP